MDDQTSKYTKEELFRLKREHEEWVLEKLYVKSDKETDDFPYLPRITSGGELFEVISGAYGYDFENDKLNSDKEVEMISYFFQEMKDWGEISDEIEMSEVVRVKFNFQEKILKLEESGF